MESIKKVKLDTEYNFLTNKPYSKKYYEILEIRQQLPIWEYKSKFLKKFKKHQVIIIEGETGSGKTTQIPQFILEKYRDQKICVTQPRRVAAMSVSQRVSEEMDVQLGQEVGYNIRFEDKSGPNTVIKYMTDGMLLREAMTNNMLQNYNTIILDETHERTLNTDILLGLLKQLVEQRSDLKLVLMSATLNTSKFSQYFSDAPLLQVHGRQFPVQIQYCDKPQEDYLQAAIDSVIKIHTQEGEGDILVFLTGEEEIENASYEIYQRLEDVQCKFQLDIIPLYSTLSTKQQQKTFEKTKKGCRKCVIATNIAETSITIDGIVYVVDPGFSKQKVFNPRMGVESLLVSPISKASAKQRSGRAGRTQAGKCYRLYTQQSFDEELIEETYPEILRSNLANLIIQLKKLGVDDLVHFDFIDPPSPESLMRGLQELFYLNCLDEEGNLTQIGECVSIIPLEPQLSVMLVSSSKVMDEMIILSSMLSVPNVFIRPYDRQKYADQIKKKYSHPDSDHISLINIYKAYKFHRQDEKWCRANFVNHRALQQADKIINQLTQILIKQEIYIQSTKDFSSSKYFDYIKKAILKGFFTQISHQQRCKTYMTIKDQQVVLIHPSSVIQHKPNFIVFNEFAITKKNYMRICTRVDVNWLLQTNQEYFDTIKLNETRKELDNAQNSEKKANNMSKIVNEMINWKNNGEYQYFETDFSKSKYKF